MWAIIIVFASFSLSVLVPPLCLILMWRFREPSLPYTFWQHLYGQMYYLLISLDVLRLCFFLLLMSKLWCYLWDFCRYTSNNPSISLAFLSMACIFPIYDGSTVFCLLSCISCSKMSSESESASLTSDELFWSLIVLECWSVLMNWTILLSCVAGMIIDFFRSEFTTVTPPRIDEEESRELGGALLILWGVQVWVLVSAPNCVAV